MRNVLTAPRIDPEIREHDLVWGILLALRTLKHERLDNTGGLIHRAFSKLLVSKKRLVRQALGFVPTPHPLFGEFRCITEALDKAHRADLVGFVNPTYREIVLKLHPETASELLQELTQDANLSMELATSFWKHYQELQSMQPR